MKWHLENRKISSLKEWEKNPRTLTEKGLKDLSKSIKKFGCAEPIIINTDGSICGGHGRKKVLEQLGIDSVDCYIPDRELTAKEFEELNIRLNKNIAGIFDMDKLANEFEIEDLKEWGFEDFEFGLTTEQKRDLKENVKEEKQRNIKIKIIYVRPEDWINYKQQIVNFFNDHEIPYEILE